VPKALGRLVASLQMRRDAEGRKIDLTNISADWRLSVRTVALPTTQVL
jgi:hypothetical protein